MENPSFSTSASPVAVDPASDSTLQFDTTQSLELPAYKPGEPVDPIFTADSPVALKDYTIGATSLNLPIEGFKPSPDLDSVLKSNTLIAATDGSLRGVAVEQTPLPEKDITLDTFKAATGELSSDSKLPKEAQDYFRQLAEVPLNADDWKIVTTKTTDSAGSQAQVTNASGQQLSQPARQALQRINTPQQYRSPYQSNSGFNLGSVASTLTRALISIG